MYMYSVHWSGLIPSPPFYLAHLYLGLFRSKLLPNNN